MSHDEMQAEILKLRAENARLKSKKAGNLSIRKSAKGGVSVYGLGRFPVTLYREQWEKLLGIAPAIIDFINENGAELSLKGDGETEPADVPAAPETAVAAS